jgi:hypothetical protein
MTNAECNVPPLTPPTDECQVVALAMAEDRFLQAFRNVQTAANTEISLGTESNPQNEMIREPDFADCEP